MKEVSCPICGSNGYQATTTKEILDLKPFSPQHKIKIAIHLNALSDSTNTPINNIYICSGPKNGYHEVVFFDHNGNHLDNPDLWKETESNYDVPPTKEEFYTLKKQVKAKYLYKNGPLKYYSHTILNSIVLFFSFGLLLTTTPLLFPDFETNFPILARTTVILGLLSIILSFLHMAYLRYIRNGYIPESLQNAYDLACKSTNEQNNIQPS